MTAENQRKSGGQLIGIALAVLLGFSVIFSLFGPEAAPDKPARIITAEMAKQCSGVIEKAMKAGIIKGQKGSNSIVVDEIQWAVLPFTVKQELLLAVGCDGSFRSKKPQLVNFADAYGYRNDQRLGRLTNDGQLKLLDQN